jgi:hypothetical protein
MYDDDDVRIGRLESYKKKDGAGKEALVSWLPPISTSTLPPSCNLHKPPSQPLWQSHLQPPRLLWQPVKVRFRTGKSPVYMSGLRLDALVATHGPPSQPTWSTPMRSVLVQGGLTEAMLPRQLEVKDVYVYKLALSYSSMFADLSRRTAKRNGTPRARHP